MKQLAILAMTLSLAAAPANATGIDDFSGNPASRWAFFTDQVMGGVSDGQTSFDGTALRLTGTVSTANNGGFIQARLKLDRRLPSDATALVLRVRGNGERYFVHLRTGGTLLPWHYYQAPFETSADWTEVRVPLAAFEASTRMVRSRPEPASVRSIAVVAYGRDHAADLSVDWVGYE